MLQNIRHQQREGGLIQGLFQIHLEGCVHYGFVQTAEMGIMNEQEMEKP